MPARAAMDASCRISSSDSGCTTMSGMVLMNFRTTSGNVPMSWLYTTRRTSTVLARSSSNSSIACKASP